MERAGFCPNLFDYVYGQILGNGWVARAGFKVCKRLGRVERKNMAGIIRFTPRRAPGIHSAWARQELELANGMGLMAIRSKKSAQDLLKWFARRDKIGSSFEGV